jgi:hypothetical protein
VLEPGQPLLHGLRPLGVATLDLVEHLGPESFALVRQGAVDLTVEVDPDAHHVRGSTVALAVLPTAISLFDAHTGLRVGGLPAGTLPARTSRARLP